MIGITPSIFSGKTAFVLGLFNASESPGKLLGAVFLAIAGLWVYRRSKKGPVLPTTLGRLAAIAGTLVAAGTLAAYWSAMQFGVDSSLVSVALSVLFVAFWGTSLCRMRTSCAVLCIVCAHSVGFVLTIVASALPAPAQIAVHVSAPLASGIIGLRLSRSQEQDEPARRRAMSSASLYRVLAGVGCLGAIMQFLFMFTEGKTVDPNELLWIVAGLSVCAVVALIGIVGPRELDIPFASRLILPLFVVGEFLIFAFDFDQKPIEVFAIGAAWMYFRFFYWIMWRAAALRSGVPAFCVFALGQVLLTLGCSVGNALYALTALFAVSEFLVLAVVCIAAILVSLFIFDTGYLSIFAGKRGRAFDPDDKSLCEHCVDEATAEFGLSRQERVIAMMLVQGKTNDEIQEELVIAYNTLRTHLRNMYKKSDTHSREELVLLLRSL